MLLINVSNNHKVLLNGTLILTSVIAIGYLYHRYFYKKKKIKSESKFSKYTIILHQYSRGLRAPSLSPYALKLETWLRIANISYEVAFLFYFIIF